MPNGAFSGSLCLVRITALLKNCGGPENELKLELVNITSYVISWLIYFHVVFSTHWNIPSVISKSSLNKHRSYNIRGLSSIIRNASQRLRSRYGVLDKKKSSSEAQPSVMGDNSNQPSFLLTSPVTRSWRWHKQWIHQHTYEQGFWVMHIGKTN